MYFVAVAGPTGSACWYTKAAPPEEVRGRILSLRAGYDYIAVWKSAGDRWERIA